MGSLVFAYELLGSPSGFISIASASLLVRFGFPWVPLYAGRVALRFYFNGLCLPLDSIWVPLGFLMGCYGRPHVLFQSHLCPSSFDFGSLGFPYDLPGSPAGFILIASLPLGSISVPLGSLMGC